MGYFNSQNGLGGKAFSSIQTTISDGGYIYTTKNGWLSYEYKGRLFNGAATITRNDILKINNYHKDMQLVVSWGAMQAAYTEDGWNTWNERSISNVTVRTSGTSTTFTAALESLNNYKMDWSSVSATANPIRCGIRQRDNTWGFGFYYPATGEVILPNTQVPAGAGTTWNNITQYFYVNSASTSNVYLTTSDTNYSYILTFPNLNKERNRSLFVGSIFYPPVGDHDGMIAVCPDTVNKGTLHYYEAKWRSTNNPVLYESVTYGGEVNKYACTQRYMRTEEEYQMVCTTNGLYATKGTLTVPTSALVPGTQGYNIMDCDFSVNNESVQAAIASNSSYVLVTDDSWNSYYVRYNGGGAVLLAMV